MRNKFPTALVILDGFGYSKNEAYNAITQSDTPHFDYLIATYPTTLLAASGPAVGLPEGYIGNSEVGHLTIGSGTPVPQPFTIIHNAIKDGSFFLHQELIENLTTLQQTGKTLHIIGLLSDAAVHSHIEHLFAFIKAAKKVGLTDVVIHPILDGRDVSPQSAEKYLSLLEEKIKEIGVGKIGSIHGRFYAMNRTEQWSTMQHSYEALTEPSLKQRASWKEALEKSYKKEITDEFFTPIQLESCKPIQDGDGVIFFNFRPDRARQLTKLLTEKIDLSFLITPVSYGPEYDTISLYERHIIPQSLTQVLHDAGHTLFSIAETEKYAHVTYFFNAGREKKLEREKRVVVPSLPSRDYKEHPCMSAATITEAIIQSLETNPRDFYVINYANADMVGHTGDLPATIKAIECLDKQLKKLYELIVTKMNGTLYITSDHGNAEDMFDPETHQPRTSHTDNPVYFIMAERSLAHSEEKLPLNELADIAPFIVHEISER